MSISIILKKGGTFPSMHISNNTALKSRGIHCAATQDRMTAEKKNIYERIEIK
jgi:signal-transduction protein with cAMP-binding, CBS, and nucleotidyltransferase domain